MELLVKNLPEQITEKQIEQFFRPVLKTLDIQIFECRKLRKGGFATITIADSQKAENFLGLYGQTTGPRGFSTAKRKLEYRGKPIYCSRSRNVPDRHLLQSMETQERRQKEAVRNQKAKPTKGPLKRKFEASCLDCGHWDYVNGSLTFMSHFQENRVGHIFFGRRSLIIDLPQPQFSMIPGQRLEISYIIIESFIIGDLRAPGVTLSLYEAPKLFEDNKPKDLMAQVLAISLRAHQKPIPEKKRVSALNGRHKSVVSSCLCYRFQLRDSADLVSIQALRRLTHIPQSTRWNTNKILKSDFSIWMLHLVSVLASEKYNKISFGVKFQFQRLAQNGYLPPETVLELLSGVFDSMSERSDTIMVPSLRKLSNQLQYPGPGVDASELSVDTLITKLTQSQESVERELLFSPGFYEQYEHIALVHKAVVTPTGIYLSGPEPEVKNRVIRKYSNFSSYFLQVSFLEEDGQTLRYSSVASNEEIYHGRFKNVLEDVIHIAGRRYEFLGFSHSSLRTQTCWFMAPFTLNKEELRASMVISRLGDFSKIRSPAKCAARIGQAFSQTFSSVSLPKDAVHLIKEVERNKRVFSDGVGTCSDSVMRKIWKEYAQSSKLKPTVFQIRYAGKYRNSSAKGMLSLDTRLEGDVVALRPSMIKFQGLDTNLEICGSGLRPLPMYLNRQLIKILEDLGVQNHAFLKLQEIAVDNLRNTTKSPLNAASFLERTQIGKAARVSWLIRKLHYLDIDFHKDDLLRNTLELAVLLQLRELKHRSRIPVEDGMTLYGIMDETGFLKEGEIFCITRTEEGKFILQGRVVVTRSPALHPGDVQYATAVNVPADSPLKALCNCVVFSSEGERDLPSQLSGGDLDGDLYNIIHDTTLYPTRIAAPADYPTQDPIDIEREVNRKDMTDFFIKFMENDQLGRIATTHQILADQKPDGTFDQDCILLADLHSTAVDFSKTGIPANLSLMPRYGKTRPDFLAPGPRVLVAPKLEFDGESDDESVENDDGDQDSSVPNFRYYESFKVLGHLYRAIDEHKTFEQIQDQSRTLNVHLAHSESPLGAVWEYVQKETALIQYSHFTSFAKDTKEAYEDNLMDTMFSYSTHPNQPLSEVEVFCGTILGTNGAQSKRQKEFSATMKEKHERDVSYTVACITHGDEGDRTEALERSLACLQVALFSNTTVRRRKVGALVSFGWIAASVCLKEVDYFTST